MKWIRQLQPGESVTSYAQVVTKQVRRKRDGEPFLHLLLRDRSGRIEAKVWDRVEECRKQIREGDFVKYRGRVETYRESRQLVLERIRRAGDEDRLQGFEESNLIPTTAEDIEGMFERLCQLVETHTRRPAVRQLLRTILAEQKEAICSFPAGIEIHHNYWGGFLEHVLSVAESALFFAGRYTRLDPDLLVAGALLHDIGKLEELARPASPTYTAKGHLIGHIVLGRDLVRAQAARIPDFPQEFLLLLEHMILAHQGQPEWGSPKKPQIPEALILHYIDDLDAKLNRFFRLLDEDPGSGEFTAFDRVLARALFKGESEERPQEVGLVSATPAAE